MAKGNDHVRDNELINVTATHSQSFLPILHNWLNPHEATAAGAGRRRNTPRPLVHRRAC